MTNFISRLKAGVLVLFSLKFDKLNFTNHKLSFRWFNTSNLISYTTWVVASFLGAVVTNVIPNPQKLGINFVIIAMFIGILYLQFISNQVLDKKLQLIVIGTVLILVYFGMVVIPSDLLILVITLLGCFVGVLLKHAIN
ncbi:hypothetical protein [Acetilactobacillus jinshanensis]|uniref:Branched-chain amino acid ABC transporter permease n=1 Tax=Acetilactobacillus jinshanensis TaxID=1720083 RepID=A0A4P6ZMZ8_9LACO|nr:hypothetical protein [Acetilactobacillus jinshanensis]QBP18590.1 hypothetical protein ELX58_05480 [Acetilactobacillus jinshanensis]URL61466.1 hypothetical protein HGK75_05620 [uncultured bacterium]